MLLLFTLIISCYVFTLMSIMRANTLQLIKINESGSAYSIFPASWLIFMLRKARLTMLSGNYPACTSSQHLLSTGCVALGSALIYTILLIITCSIPAWQTGNRNLVRLRTFCRMTVWVRLGTGILTQTDPVLNLFPSTSCSSSQH